MSRRHIVSIFLWTCTDMHSHAQTGPCMHMYVWARDASMVYRLPLKYVCVAPRSSVETRTLPKQLIILSGYLFVLFVCVSDTVLRSFAAQTSKREHRLSTVKYASSQQAIDEQLFGLNCCSSGVSGKIVL